MLRRITMWIAVISLAALACVSATSATIYIFATANTGWTFYTPASVAGPAFQLEPILFFCAFAQRLLLPLAAASSAVYLYLAERFLRSLRVSHGFEIQASDLSDRT